MKGMGICSHTHTQKEIFAQLLRGWYMCQMFSSWGLFNSATNDLNPGATEGHTDCSGEDMAGKP